MMIGRDVSSAPAPTAIGEEPEFLGIKRHELLVGRAGDAGDAAIVIGPLSLCSAAGAR